MNGADPSVHEILYAIKPKADLDYPVWMRPFYLFAMLADGQGVCQFHAEMRLVTLDDDMFEVESLVGKSKSGSHDLGQHPLRTRFMSILMPAVLLPKPGVYRVYLIADGETIAIETILAR